MLQDQDCYTMSFVAAICTASYHDTRFICERMLRTLLGTRYATCLDRDLDLELALLLDEYGDLLRLLLLCFPFSLVASRAGLPSGLEGSFFVCNTTVYICNVNRSKNCSVRASLVKKWQTIQKALHLSRTLKQQTSFRN